MDEVELIIKRSVWDNKKGTAASIGEIEIPGFRVALESPR